jgi:hypothetical protein
MTALEQKQFNLRVLKKCRLSFWICLGLVVGLAVVKLVLSNRYATAGRQVEAVLKETTLIRTENEQLKLELVRRSGGLETLKQQALEAGFVEKPNYWYPAAKDNVAQALP